MSARSDDLVVRLDDDPRQGRLTVVLDVQERASRPEPFERMVSAAASIASAHWVRGDIVRLLQSDGRDTGWVTGQAAFESLLEVLAVTERVPAALLSRVLARTDAGTDTVVAVTGDLTDVDIASLPGRRSARAGRLAGLSVVRFPAVGPGRAHQRVIEGVRVLDVGPDRAFADVWGDAVSSRSHTPVGSP